MSGIDSVKEYYGKIIKSSSDLKTTACCPVDALPGPAREVAKLIHPEVRDRFYGCGSPFPPALEGRTVLDLGCGTGRDVFILSKLVGPQGRVIGVDMTDEQLEVAHRHLHYHMEKFGYREPNVMFKKGYIEDLKGAGIEDGSIDLVVSNCVTNLSPDKHRVFSEIFRVLKPGGELYFSDVFADRRIPEPLTKDPVLLGECLGGAMYKEDFRRLMLQLGCADFRLVSSGPVTLTNDDIIAKIGMVQFSSVTFRAFKLELEDRCEDYGQVATYKGSIKGYPHAFTLDDHHHFLNGKPMLVCGNTADMISKTYYARHFEVTGNKMTHLGLFDCAPAAGNPSPSASGASCC